MANMLAETAPLYGGASVEAKASAGLRFSRNKLCQMTYKEGGIKPVTTNEIWDYAMLAC